MAVRYHRAKRLATEIYPWLPMASTTIAPNTAHIPSQMHMLKRLCRPSTAAMLVASPGLVLGMVGNRNMRHLVLNMDLGMVAGLSMRIPVQNMDPGTGVNLNTRRGNLVMVGSPAMGRKRVVGMSGSLALGRIRVMGMIMKGGLRGLTTRLRFMAEMSMRGLVMGMNLPGDQVMEGQIMRVRKGESMAIRGVMMMISIVGLAMDVRNMEMMMMRRGIISARITMISDQNAIFEVCFPPCATLLLWSLEP